MRRISTFVLVLAASVGCSGSGGDASDPGTTATDTPAVATDVVQPDTAGADVPLPGDVAGEAVATVQFTGQLVDFQTKAPKEGLSLQRLDNETRQPVGEPFLSGKDGAVALTLPATPDKIGFKVWGKDPGNPNWWAEDTYQFNIRADAVDRRLYGVSNVTFLLVPTLAGVKIDHTKGILAGAIYYQNGAGEDENVGCALVEATPAGGGAAAGDIRYFDPEEDMPAPLSSAPNTRKANSFYMIANLPVGEWVVTVHLTTDTKKTVLGTVSIPAYEDSITISNIYAEDASKPGTNPTPADAACQ